LLGPSILIAGPPFATGYAFHVCRRHACPKIAAFAGLGLAVIELLALVALMIYGALE
jgi:hypothetical protein